MLLHGRDEPTLAEIEGVKGEGLPSFTDMLGRSPGAKPAQVKRPVLLTGNLPSPATHAQTSRDSGLAALPWFALAPNRNWPFGHFSTSLNRTSSELELASEPSKCRNFYFSLSLSLSRIVSHIHTNFIAVVMVFVGPPNPLAAVTHRPATRPSEAARPSWDRVATCSSCPLAPLSNTPWPEHCLIPCRRQHQTSQPPKGPMCLYPSMLVCNGLRRSHLLCFLNRCAGAVLTESTHLFLGNAHY